MFNAFPILAMTFVLGIHVAPAQAEVTWDIQPDTWVATDGLGRSLPVHAHQIIDCRSGKSSLRTARFVSSLGRATVGLLPAGTDGHGWITLRKRLAGQKARTVRNKSWSAPPSIRFQILDAVFMMAGSLPRANGKPLKGCILRSNGSVPSKSLLPLYLSRVGMNG